MGTIISSGVGSGLDINGLVTQLVQAEGQPRAVALNTKEAALQGKLSAFGTFRSAVDKVRTALANLKSLDKFQARTAASSAVDKFTVTATSAAAPGSYAIEVVTLAQAQKQVSAPVATAATVVGTGTLSLTVNGTTANLVIDSTNNTLAGIRDAINRLSNNPGVQATIVTATDGARLVLTGTKTGAANAITVGYNGSTLSTLALAETLPALDSSVKIDGFTVNSSTNKVTGAIDGVELNLVGASATGVTSTLSVSLNRTDASKAVADFVTGYNALVNGIKSQGAYNAETKTGGPLLGDTTLRDFNGSLRRELSLAAGVDGDLYRRLSDIGISVQLDGTLATNQTKLDAALNTRFDDVGKLFAGDTGVAKRLDALFERYVSANGLLDARTKGIQSSLQDIAKQREALDARLTTVEARLRKQFNALDTLLAQMKQTSNYLTTQLANLPGSG
jgi:flagellar hook-associated protein 2